MTNNKDINYNLIKTNKPFINKTNITLWLENKISK